MGDFFLDSEGCPLCKPDNETHTGDICTTFSKV